MTDEEKLDLALVIEELVEHDDGSATVTVRFGPTVHKNLIETGLGLVFRCAASGLSIDEALDQINYYDCPRLHISPLSRLLIAC